MSLTLQQRLDRINVRVEELGFWRDREVVAIDGWNFEGAPIALGAFWPKKEGVLKLDAKAVVPEHWSLEDTRLSLDVGGESLIALQPEGSTAAERFGLDPFHQEFPVPAHRFDILIDAVARLPFGEPVREPRLTRAFLLLVDRPVEDLELLLRQVAEAAHFLGDHEVVPHLIAAAEQTFAALDWPSATEDYVSRTAPQRGQQKIWQLPPLKPNPAGLRQDQRASVVAAFASLREKLVQLKARYPQQGKLAITGHAHIDLAWLWPYAETRRKARRTFHTALQLMEAFPDFVFNQSTAAYYAQIEEDDPALFKAIQAQVKNGQWETVGAMWVEPDTNMPTGESFVRQLLYGQRYFEKKFGVRHRVCWLPDCFGFSGALPQLLQQAGVDSFFTIKVNWSETNKFPHDLFWWEGLDGSRVLAHTFDNPVRGYNGSTEPEAIIGTWKNFRGKVIYDESLLAIGYGDGGGGVTPEMLRRQAQLADFPAVPALTGARVEDFFARAHEIPAKTLPVWSGEIYLELHRATLTTQSGTKKKHREAERALITAETISSLAMLFGADKPESLETAWRAVLKNEFHDILPGSGIREVYVDAENELAEARDVGLARQRDALDALIARLPKGEAHDVIVAVNPSLSERPFRVETADGPLATDATVAPLGVAVIGAHGIVASHGLTVSESLLENAHIRVEIGKDGAIASLYDKRAGREALEGRGNQLWVYPMDKPRNWDAWDLEDDYEAHGIELTEVESVEIVERGPHRAAVKIVKRFRDSTITQTYSLWANAGRIDIKTHLDWHDRRVLLRTLTPVAVRSAYATFECAFGVVCRPTHTNTSWDAAKFEVPGHRFADLAEPGFGVALLNDAKYGHSVHDNVLGLSLLRSPIYPDPLADEGEQSFVYALMPHGGDWFTGGVLREAEDLNQPLLARKATGVAVGAHVPLVVQGHAVALAGLKPAEDSADIVLRVYEPAGGRGGLTVEPASGWSVKGDVNLLEESVARDKPHGILPFEVRSLLLGK
ncbi:glycosyl hydrolase-related protein [Kaistia dalseonensis]|uniref:Alpha-mannosidase n=1 Tax=Kaistia dalseonensis TaxID=410840 RepID=A0ABU0HBJ5_9HYPH|nr:glycoside hydrolase family 38 C-terminal domain-containing protein [Kaistia dalseonensis]MCX5496736.1 glycosyl hydrolase-related protein [Kaistia dalseonensis]MDQ0439362.1 alpha-mannosidase [Kaistia dalseonensis]